MPMCLFFPNFKLRREIYVYKFLFNGLISIWLQVVKRMMRIKIKQKLRMTLEVVSIPEFRKTVMLE